jgi:cell division septation protein DedD
VELQIGAFADRGNAERAARTARVAGPTRIQPTTVGGVTLHRVIVGPGGEASMRAALARLGFSEARAVRGS